MLNEQEQLDDTFEIGSKRGGAEVVIVLNQRGVVEEAEQHLQHDVLKHKVVVIISRRLLHVLWEDR